MMCLRDQIAQIKRACTVVRTSAKLRVVLRSVLYLGNKLNEGRGRVYGFQLNSLGMLRSIKSQDKQFTLLHFLVKHINNTEGAKGFVSELEAAGIKHVAGVDPKVLVEELREVENTLSFLKTCLKGFTSTLPARVTRFGDEANAQFQAVAESHEQAISQFADLSSFFGLPDADWQRFFGVWATFVQDYKTAEQELKRRAERERMQDARRQARNVMISRASSTASRKRKA